MASLRGEVLVWWSTVVLAAVGAAACSSPAPPTPAPVASAALWPDDVQVVDLTHAFDARTLVWPTSDPFRLEPVFDGTTPGGWHYASNTLHTTEHGGTHLDAPIHFAAGRQTADQVPLRRLMRPALVVDVTRQAAADRDALVTVADLEAWQTQHGAVDAEAIVLVRTGFAAFWPDPVTYLGTAARGEAGVRALRFPGLAPEAARWLVDRRVAAVGIDTASIDRGQSTTFETHRVLAEADVPIFENLTGLDQLPARGATVLALPMKIGGGSGGPLRAVALVRP